MLYDSYTRTVSRPSNAYDSKCSSFLPDASSRRRARRVVRVRRGGRTVIKECVITRGVEIPPLAHGEARFLEEVVDLTVHDAGVYDRLRFQRLCRRVVTLRACGSRGGSLRRLDGRRGSILILVQKPVAAARQGYGHDTNGGPKRCFALLALGRLGRAHRPLGQLKRLDRDAWTRRRRHPRRAFLRNGLGDRAFEHRAGLALVDRNGQDREDVRAFHGRAELFFGVTVREQQSHRVWRLRESLLDVAAYVRYVAGVDDQQLGPLRARQMFDRRRDRINGADRRLSAERFSQLQQEVVARGEGDQVDRRF